jgi:hypothetical protein
MLKWVPDYSEMRKLAPPGPDCEYVFVAGFPSPENSGVQGFFEEAHSHSPNVHSLTLDKPPLQEFAAPLSHIEELSRAVSALQSNDDSPLIGILEQGRLAQAPCRRANGLE